MVGRRDGLDLFTAALTDAGCEAYGPPGVGKTRLGDECLEMVGRLYRLTATQARTCAADVLDRFSLTDAADRRVATYSGGMRRRLDLGASLTGRPPVILLDEPTTGLDPRTRQELWDCVDGLRRVPD